MNQTICARAWYALSQSKEPLAGQAKEALRLNPDERLAQAILSMFSPLWHVVTPADIAAWKQVSNGNKRKRDGNENALQAVFDLAMRVRRRQNKTAILEFACNKLKSKSPLSIQVQFEYYQLAKYQHRPSALQFFRSIESEAPTTLREVETSYQIAKLKYKMKSKQVEEIEPRLRTVIGNILSSEKRVASSRYMLAKLLPAERNALLLQMLDFRFIKLDNLKKIEEKALRLLAARNPDYDFEETTALLWKVANQSHDLRTLAYLVFHISDTYPEIAESLSLQISTLSDINIKKMFIKKRKRTNERALPEFFQHIAKFRNAQAAKGKGSVQEAVFGFQEVLSDPHVSDYFRDQAHYSLTGLGQPAENYLQSINTGVRSKELQALRYFQAGNVVKSTQPSAAFEHFERAIAGGLTLVNERAALCQQLLIQGFFKPAWGLAICAKLRGSHNVSYLKSCLLELTNKSDSARRQFFPLEVQFELAPGLLVASLEAKAFKEGVESSPTFSPKQELSLMERGLQVPETRELALLRKVDFLLSEKTSAGILEAQQILSGDFEHPMERIEARFILAGILADQNPQESVILLLKILVDPIHYPRFFAKAFDLLTLQVPAPIIQQFIDDPSTPQDLLDAASFVASYRTDIRYRNQGSFISLYRRIDNCQDIEELYQFLVESENDKRLLFLKGLIQELLYRKIDSLQAWDALNLNQKKFKEDVALNTRYSVLNHRYTIELPNYTELRRILRDPFISESNRSLAEAELASIKANQKIFHVVHLHEEPDLLNRAETYITILNLGYIRSANDSREIERRLADIPEQILIERYNNPEFAARMVSVCPWPVAQPGKPQPDTFSR